MIVRQGRSLSKQAEELSGRKRLKTSLIFKVPYFSPDLTHFFWLMFSIFPLNWTCKYISAARLIPLSLVALVNLLLSYFTRYVCMYLYVNVPTQVYMEYTAKWCDGHWAELSQYTLLGSHRNTHDQMGCSFVFSYHLLSSSTWVGKGLKSWTWARKYAYALYA